MNKSLRQNWKIFNNIKFHPLGECEETCPRNKQDAANWADQVWNHLVNDEIERCAIYIRKGIANNKYNITVWNDGKIVYLVVCLRTEFATDSTTIYMQPYTQDNLSDFIALAKFTHKEMMGIVGHSIKAYQEIDKLVQEKLAEDTIDAAKA